MRRRSKSNPIEGGYFSGKNRIDESFKSIGYRDAFSKWFRPMSLDMLFKKINKLSTDIHKLHNKVESKKEACRSRSKSIPKNATIRKEFVKCKKPNCRRKQHGPYYYAYWKDPETKGLKKKYIGRNYFPNDEQKKQEEKRTLL